MGLSALVLRRLSSRDDLENHVDDVECGPWSLPILRD
jgi:hypothetical protein